MKRFFLLLIIGISIAACQSKSDFEGFKKSRKGFHYQLHTLGESERNVKINDYVTADINYYTLDDSLFFEGRRKIKLGQPAYQGAVEDCFMFLKLGESASFILQAGPFFKVTLESDIPEFLSEESYFKVKLSIIEIQSELEFEKEKQAFLSWIEDFGHYEKVILKHFISQEKIDVKPTKSGLIYLPLEKTNGAKIELGDTITINYEGRFMNGKYFDSTVRTKSPFQFVFGTEWQVIQGMEEGLALMHEGEKALFIMPSELAFGSEGSSTGIIPPFTSLIYEVEIIKVNKGQKK
jgi:FKBP-type peptidyl-prolyl cis-trans isomerase